MDAGDQLILMERLGEVVVGAEAEAFDLVFCAGEAGKDQNRGFDAKPRSPTYPAGSSPEG